MEPGLESFLAHLVALRPEPCVVLDLFVDHRVEDNGDLVRSRGGGGGRAKFGFHAAKVMTHGCLIPMQRMRCQSEQSPGAVLGPADA